MTAAGRALWEPLYERLHARADGQTYFHSFQVHLSELYLVNGLR